MQLQLTNSPEEWRPVVSYEGWYEVSNRGRIKRVGKTRGATPGRILGRYPCGWGYHVTRLSRNNDRGRLLPIHTLVAEAFIEPRPLGREVNHKDGNKTNNTPSNLEWATRSENNRHAIRTGLKKPLIRRGEQHGMAKLSGDDVQTIRKLRGRLTQKQLASRFHVSKNMVWLIQHRRNWTHI